MQEIFTIIRNLYPITVLKMRVKDLDFARCPNKFLSVNLSDDELVYVKCDEDGNVKYKGKKLKYSLFNVSEYLPTEKPYKSKFKYNRYISDGDSLYGVPDMAMLLKESKQDLMQIYVFTKYNYAFECAIRAGIESGVLEKKDPNAEYYYPFDEVKDTLGDFVKSGIFTDEDLAFLDERVLDEFDETTDNIIKA